MLNINPSFDDRFIKSVLYGRQLAFKLDSISVVFLFLVYIYFRESNSFRAKVEKKGKTSSVKKRI